jgi:DNA polymerase elongation subunit (family B)
MNSSTYLDPESDELVFQIADILSRDSRVATNHGGGDDTSDSDRAPKDDKLSARRFQILLFGSNAQGQSVCLTVENFKPFFYVRIPEALVSHSGAVRSFKRWILNGIPRDEADHCDFTLEKHQTLFDYNCGALATFMKITVPSQALWRAVKNRFLTKDTCNPIAYETKSLFGMDAAPILVAAPKSDDIASLDADGSHIALKVYEANIDPVLRFFHMRDVSPAGWVRTDNWAYTESRDIKTAIAATADWDDIHPAPDGGMAPYVVGSWDIECMSSHGDFPLAVKTWRKPVRELYESGLPTSIEALCASLADAINGKSRLLSSIYLKRPMGVVLGETLRLMLEGKGMLRVVADALAGLATVTKETREKAISALDNALTKGLPAIAGDEIIQIGTVLYKHGAPLSKHIWVLGSCVSAEVKPPGADVPIGVYPCRTEAEMIRSWFAWIGSKQPDILIGYNIFGFDSKYIWDRIGELFNAEEAKRVAAPLSYLGSRPPRLEEKFLSSSAMGDNTMYFLGSPGRLQIDLLPYVRRNANLDSYTLDNVSATFVSGAVLGALKPTEEDEYFRFGTKSTKGTVIGRYITLLDSENDRVVDRCAVVGVEPKALIVHIPGGAAVLADHGAAPVRWAQVKDDVSPKDIFRLHRGSASDRATIARYCLQDCDLVMELFYKLEVFNNSVAMAQVCSVPVSYIFTRGQGIKIESLIFKECRKVDQLIEVLDSQAREPLEPEIKETGSEDEEDDEAEDSYEGAIVLEPHTGIYLDDPVTADDFASLYPSSIISENISHDTLIWVKDYDNDGNFVSVREGSDQYDNLPGATYVNVEFDILRSDPADTRKHPAKIRDGKRIARYVQPADPYKVARGDTVIGTQGTIPRILQMLLDNRKRVRKLAEKEPDEFRRALLDAQQLAYKLTANSLYGQLGSGTFKIRRQVLAASTTGYGRKQLMYAKAVIEHIYGGGKDPRCDVECVYGDTDSIFLRFRPRDPVTGERLRGAEALRVAKELTIESGKLVSSCLKPPHDFEFDKIFKCFILLSKKRYVGDMSEDGLEDDDFHRKSMGIVMKRRDNAPIVKYVYGNAIERILSAKSVEAGVRDAAEFVTQATRDLLAGKFPLSKLTITKSLRSEYKDPLRIAHKVLADRIGERDPGNKPSTSDRIPYVYISNGAGPVPKLQGDRIELPSYIKEKGLRPDYAFYVTNQIAKPVSQVFGLAVHALPGATPGMMAKAGSAPKPVKAYEKLAQQLLFDAAIADAARDPSAMEAKGQRSIASMFQKKSV